ncbi:MAG: hypothetical protein Q9213_007127 [Squamulea squamosa]
MFFLPESPRWLARKDRWDEAHAILTLVHGKGDSNSPFVLRELEEIREMVNFEKQNSDVTYLELLKPHMINRTHIGVFTQIWSQLTGMNVMSATLMMLCLFANAGILASYGKWAGPNGVQNTKEASWEVSGAPSKAVIAFSYLFVASYAPSWGPVSWIYPPELYPLRVRGKAVSLATSANWAFNFALGYFVPPAFVNIKWQTYLIFGIFCLSMTIHTFFMFPETAGKTLEEVVDIFEDPSGIGHLGTPAWKTRASTKRTVMLEQNRLNEAEKGAGDHQDSPDRRGSETAGIMS